MHFNKSFINYSLIMKSDEVGFVMEQYLVGNYSIIAAQRSLKNTMLCISKVKWNVFKPYLVPTTSSYMPYGEKVCMELLHNKFPGSLNSCFVNVLWLLRSDYSLEHYEKCLLTECRNATFEGSHLKHVIFKR